MPAITVRPAAVDDLLVLGDMLTNLHGRPPWSPEEEPTAREALSEIVADPSRGLSLAFVDGRPAGTIDVIVARNLTRDLRPFAMIENVVVIPGLRRQGVGRRLIETALRFAESLGCYKVQLVSAGGRGAGHQLYETTGFDAPVVGYRRYLAPAAG
jgi:GNAT superfamily N-acetyltransferase